MRKIKIFFVFFVLILSVNSYAQSVKLKPVFIYNFIKNIEWPDDYQSGNFVIGIVGETPVVAELTNMASSRKAGNQDINVNQYSNVENIGVCHIIYIPPEQSQLLGAVIERTSGNSTLIITEKSGLAKSGACINFIYENEEQQFELNQVNIEKRGLKVSSTLMNLSILVD